MAGVEPDPLVTGIDAPDRRMQQQHITVLMQPHAVYAEQANGMRFGDDAWTLQAALERTKLTQVRAHFCCMRWKRASTLRSFSGFGGLTPYL